MFAEALLESSPSRAPVLKKDHYFYATACGALASLACFLALGRRFSPTSIRVLTIQSLLIGGLVAAFALMLCYVHVDSRQLALNTAFWVALTFVLNFAGFVCFLVYAAARTGDWKRAAIPCAYIGEVLLVGAMALVPLIYTEALPKAVWTEVLRAPSPPPPPPSSMGTQALRRAARGVSSDEENFTDICARDGSPLPISSPGCCIDQEANEACEVQNEGQRDPKCSIKRQLLRVSVHIAKHQGKSGDEPSEEQRLNGTRPD